MKRQEIQERRRERLSAASEKVGGDAELGRMLGHRSGAQVGHMRLGRRPITEKTIERIDGLNGLADWFRRPDLAAAGGVAAWAIGADGQPELESIRVMKLRLQAGVPGFAAAPDEDEAASIFFRPEWLNRRGFEPSKLVATRVSGESMERTLFRDDLVVANTADVEPRDGAVYSINYEGEPVIKRLFRDAGEWWLTSDNPDKARYPNKRWVDKIAIIIGCIVHRQSERI